MAETKSYEGWGIVELFGHQQIAGRLSEYSIGGASFLRVDVPELDNSQPFTKFYGGGAIYAITPTDETTAKIAAGKIQSRPVELWIVPSSPIPRRAELPEPTTIDHGSDGFDDVEDYP